MYKIHDKGAVKMKLTDNMLRVISHAYSNNSPLLYLNKAGLYNQITDMTILKKSYEVAAIINSLASKASMESEKEFYTFKLNAEQFTRAMAKERERKNIVTVRELIAGGGVVYSYCLEYINDYLTKYEGKTVDLEKFTKSLDETYNKLLKIAGQNEANINVEDLLKEVQYINDINEQLSGQLSNANSKIEALNNIVSTTKTNMQDIALLATVNRAEDIEEQAEELENLQKEIKEIIENKNNQSIKNIVLPIITGLKEEIELIPASTLEHRAVTDILSTVKSLENKIDNTDNLKAMDNIAERLLRLDDLIDVVQVDNKARYDLLDGATDGIERNVQRFRR